MNTNMYENPITQANLQKLRDFGMEVIEPATGLLACKAVGKGKMPSEEVLLSDGCEISGTVCRSIIGPGVVVEKGAVVKDSIIMAGTIIGENALVDHCVIDEKCSIGKNVQMGVGENIPNEAKPNIYNTGITVLGMNSSVPDGIVMGKNCVIYGRTFPEDYPDGRLESGKAVVREV